MKNILISLATLFTVLFTFTHCQTNQQKEKEAPPPITPATALDRYLHNNDSAFQWEVIDTFSIDNLKAYELLLTSQRWREHTWRHQLTVLAPEKIEHDGALLFITGGSNKNEKPNWKKQDDETLQAFAQVAAQNKAVVSIIRQVPNQPLYDDLTEDALISFTLHNFKKDKDYTWPLLFPMVKSAMRAMDAVQAFSQQTLQQNIDRFVVSGASKRGWTTWLTGANDKRVAAIAPMVIDVLNMPVNLDYQIKVWNEYSPQINDYVKLGIPQEVNTGKGDTLTQMIDPYAYRKNVSMPKMIFIGTNDEYWPVDAIKHYIDSIPGENYIHYVPNAGHGLGDKKQALQALNAFFGYTLHNADYPEYSWDVSTTEKEITLSVKAESDKLIDAILWSTDSKDRDFRDEEWKSTSLQAKNKTEITANTSFPASGFKAFYIDLKYKDTNGGSYTQSTRMYVADDDEVFVK